MSQWSVLIIIENYAMNLMNFSNNVNAMGNLFNVHQISQKT